MNPITLKLNSKLTFIAFSCLFVSAAIYCFSSFSSPASIQHEKNKDVKSNPKLSTNLFSVFSKSSSSWRITSKYPHCNILVPLPFYNGTSEESDQLFFLETSGKSYLSGRQACSVESAALYSGKRLVFVIPILTMMYFFLNKSYFIHFLSIFQFCNFAFDFNFDEEAR